LNEVELLLDELANGVAADGRRAEAGVGEACADSGEEGGAGRVVDIGG
jgi:hypothetical protein